MSETLVYIESYFENQLAEEDRQIFEQRIVNDEAFAQDVAFYLTARLAIRQEVQQQKEVNWTVQPASEPAKVIAASKVKNRIATWRMVAVAASIALLICLGYVFIYQSANSQRLAATYVHDRLNQLRLTMDGSRDSVQQGIAAYNQGDYATAEKLFINVYQHHPDQSDALKFSGITSLKQKDYTEAIERFKRLAATPLFANPGCFYQAVALLLRNNGNDRTESRKLLQEVVDKGLEGKEYAAEWLQAMH
jgi:tetratricopeptide (TPR) repeat protein